MPTPRRYPHAAARQAAYRQRCRETLRQALAPPTLPPRPAVASLPGPRRWQAMLGQASCWLDTAAREMQEYYDQRSEKWQESERGAVFLEQLEALQEALSAVTDLSA